MVLDATLNNISVISWWSVLLVEETWVHGENHRPVGSHRQTLSHNFVWSIRTHNVSGDGTDCISSWKSSYHTITTTTTPYKSIRRSRADSFRI